MQLRKHAAPPLGDSFFTAGVAVPPDFAGATLAMGHPDLPALPLGPKARLVSAGKLMAASAMTAIPRLRYMRVSLVSRVVVGPQPQHAVTELVCRTPASNDVMVITWTRHSRCLSSGRSHTCCRDALTLHRHADEVIKRMPFCCDCSRSLLAQSGLSAMPASLSAFGQRLDASAPRRRTRHRGAHCARD